MIDVPVDLPRADMSDTADAPTLIGMDGDLASPSASADSAPSVSSPASADAPARPSKRGRAAMPSWDEIVFGARPDDDPA